MLHRSDAGRYKDFLLEPSVSVEEKCAADATAFIVMSDSDSMLQHVSESHAAPSSPCFAAHFDIAHALSHSERQELAGVPHQGVDWLADTFTIRVASESGASTS